MGTVNGSSVNDLGLSLQQSGSNGRKTRLDQADFLRLMTAQLQHQDPTKPMDNAEFLGQMAQFSTVSGLQDLQQSFASLASSLQSAQTLQATQLVGHAVLVPGSSGVLADGSALQAAVDVTGSGSVSVDVLDASGQVVRRLDLGSHGGGLAAFSWDGLDAGGHRLPAGRYELRAVLEQGGSRQALSTCVVDRVQSVALGASGISLQLASLGTAALSDVRQIY